VRKSISGFPENINVKGYEIVSSFRYLGVKIDSSLILSPHLKTIKLRIVQIVQYAYKIKKLLPLTRLIIYILYFSSFILYGSEIFELFPNKLKNQLNPILYKPLK